LQVTSGSDRGQKESLGITVKKKDELSEWYTQTVLKAELADYSSSGKGFMVIRPNGYEIWELIRNFFDSEIKKTGHRNAYFPTLIPRSLLEKESEHFAGFNPEVFWVTKAGTEELSDPLAIRPTSETIIHDAIRNWIRSWRDLPLLLNVWNSVLRAEIKSTKPFLRSTEFLWQEGHTSHASEEEAAKEVMDILTLYKRIMEELAAFPVLIGRKSDREKFVGAVYTTTLEAMMPDGKALQMGTSHQLGQNFSKPFEIRFLGENGEMQYVWQTSWGTSWRIIGSLVMVHGDDRGLVVPPRLAPVQVVIVPILFSKKGSPEKLMQKCSEIQTVLQGAGVRAQIDSRENYTPGWKFNEWEMKGVPLRIELGPRDLEKDVLVFVRRDNGSKITVPTGEASARTIVLLSEIQENLWSKAKEQFESSIHDVSSYAELVDVVERKGGFVRSFWCGSPKCEIEVKEKTGADIRVIPFDQPENVAERRCIVCGEPAKSLVYFARAY
jgi:prolyl-tRNA synthetase